MAIARAAISKFTPLSGEELVPFAGDGLRLAFYVLAMSKGLIKAISSECLSGCRKIVRCGFYVRASDQRKVQRYRCSVCGKTSSEATSDLNRGQRKRHLNSTIALCLTAGYSQRRLALDLNINRKTVVRKFILMGTLAIRALPIYNLRGLTVASLEFDDMETSIHTKCKPVSIALAVESKTRRILGFRIAEMPAKGRLAKISVKRYGRRKDERSAARKDLFEELKPLIAGDCVIKTDENPHYVPDIKTHFPGHAHERFKGRRGCVVGQGELKRGGRDPLFSLNHTCAMLRASINRLFRRTWCTTKRADRLSMHIALYAINHNLRLINR